MGGVCFSPTPRPPPAQGLWGCRSPGSVRLRPPPCPCGLGILLDPHFSPPSPLQSIGCKEMAELPVLLFLQLQKSLTHGVKAVGAVNTVTPPPALCLDAWIRTSHSIQMPSQTPTIAGLGGD